MQGSEKKRNHSTDWEAIVYTAFDASNGEIERIGPRDGRMIVRSRSTSTAAECCGRGDIFFKIPARW